MDVIKGKVSSDPNNDSHLKIKINQKLYDHILFGFFAGQKHEQVVDYIQKKTDSKVDWWLHADEAVLYGFADEVF